MSNASPVSPSFSRQLGRSRNLYYDGRRVVATFWRTTPESDPEQKSCVLEIMPYDTVLKANRLALVTLPFEKHTMLDHLPDEWRDSADTCGHRVP